MIGFSTCSSEPPASSSPAARPAARSASSAPSRTDISYGTPFEAKKVPGRLGALADRLEWCLRCSATSGAAPSGETFADAAQRVLFDREDVLGDLAIGPLQLASACRSMSRGVCTVTVVSTTRPRNRHWSRGLRPCCDRHARKVRRDSWRLQRGDGSRAPRQGLGRGRDVEGRRRGGSTRVHTRRAPGQRVRLLRLPPHGVCRLGLVRGARNTRRVSSPARPEATAVTPTARWRTRGEGAMQVTC